MISNTDLSRTKKYLLTYLGHRLRLTEVVSGSVSSTIISSTNTERCATALLFTTTKILKLRLPYTLKDLEHYLGLTRWLRGFVELYAQEAEPLTQRKTALLRQSPSNEGKIERRASAGGRSLIRHRSPS